MQRVTPHTLLLSLLLFVLLTTFQVAANSVVNFSTHNLHRAVADLGASKSWGLNTEGFATIKTDDGTRWPAQVINGRLYAAVSLKAQEKKAVSDIEKSKPPLVVSVDGLSARMSNGLLEWSCRPTDTGAPRWALSLASDQPGEDTLLLKEMRYRGYLDSESRGRLQRREYDDLGAVDIELLPIKEIILSESADAVTVRVIREESPKFPGLEMAEEYTLRAGRPLLEYRMRPINRGSQPVYLAYVYWEGDLHGDYGRALAGDKLVAAPYAAQPLRLATAATGTMLTRWGRGWGSERAWLGMQGADGIGLGITTPEMLTEKHYYGSSIWVSRPKDIHLDLTETTRGYYPVELAAGADASELGLDLIFTQGGVPAGTVARQWLLQAKQPTRQESLLNNLTQLLPVAVLNNENETIRPIPAMAAITTTDTARLPEFSALAAPRRLEIQISGLDPTGKVKVMAEQGSRQAVLGEIDGNGPHELLLEPTKTPLLKKPWNLRLQTSVANTQSSPPVIERITLGEPRPAAPALQSPLPGQDITDIATFFRWVSVPHALAYELEYGPHDNPQQAKRQNIQFLGNLPHFMPDELPSPGRYSWRVRAILPDGTTGDWSESSHFTVNNDLTPGKHVRPIGPDNPLFSLEAHGPKSLLPFMDAVPEDLRPFTAINFGHTKYYGSIRKSLLEFVHEPTKEGKQNLSMLIRWGGHGSMDDVYVSLSELEAIFQQCPWVIGVIGGESFDQINAKNPYVRRLIQLCAKYGRWFIEGDGNYSTNKLHRLASEKKVADLLRQYSDYIVLSQKNNIHYMQHVTQGSVMGMWLSGMVGQAGSWEDAGWYWEQVGFRGLGEWQGVRSGDIAQTPAIYWALTWVHGLSQGCTVFHVDGQVSTRKTPDGTDPQQAADFKNQMKHQVWDTEGNTLEAFHRVIVPFFRAVIAQKLIPTKQQVIDQLEVAVREDQPWTQEIFTEETPYAHYTWLYRETYGFFDERGSADYEYFPNTGRFGYFPILPLDAPALVKSDGRQVREAPVSQLGSPEAVRKVFHDAFAGNDYGNALVIRYPDRFFVQNTNENKDITEQASVPVGAAGIERVEAKIGPHMYLIGRWGAAHEGLWMQTNSEYPERPVSIHLFAEKEPTVAVTPADALLDKLWNAEQKRMELQLSTEKGAVNISVNQ
jgi:hypothetical protein